MHSTESALYSRTSCQKLENTIPIVIFSEEMVKSSSGIARDKQLAAYQRRVSVEKTSVESSAQTMVKRHRHCEIKIESFLSLLCTALYNIQHLCGSLRFKLLHHTYGLSQVKSHLVHQIIPSYFTQNQNAQTLYAMKTHQFKRTRFVCRYIQILNVTDLFMNRSCSVCFSFPAL